MTAAVGRWVASAGYITVGIVDLVMVWRMFGRGFLWGLFALSPVGWIVGPFFVGLGTLFLATAAVTGVGALMMATNRDL